MRFPQDAWSGPEVPKAELHVIDDIEVVGWHQTAQTLHRQQLVLAQSTRRFDEG
jgi:hypothetical protein